MRHRLSSRGRFRATELRLFGLGSEAEDVFIGLAPTFWKPLDSGVVSVEPRLGQAARRGFDFVSATPSLARRNASIVASSGSASSTLTL